MAFDAVNQRETLLAGVRGATASAHAHVEQLVDVTAPWDQSRYLAFLRATLAVVEPIEPALRRVFGDRFPLLAGSSARLHADIASLGGSGAGRAAPNLPAIASAAEGFGAAYVLLGSLLGGRILARTIQSQLDLPSTSLTYLRPTDEMGPNWKQFTSAMNEWGATADSHTRDATIATATHLFDAFTASFTREGFA
jgi:heme oxygenase (biliverdin-IX-beta and delta-forming)